MGSLTRFRRLFQLGIFAALMVGSLAVSSGSAAAQGFGWFGNLFGGGSPRQQQSAPSYSAPGTPPGGGGSSQPERYFERPHHHVARRKPPVDDAQREAPPKEKTPPKNASVFVYVFGDSLGQMLANGLDDALADRQDVAVIHKAHGSTGLVNTEYYDWPKAIDELVGSHDKPQDKTQDKTGPKNEAERSHDDRARDAKTNKDDKGKHADAKSEVNDKKSGEVPKETRPKIDVAVMMIGSNDRQPMQVDGKTVQPGTTEWTAAYTKRVLAIDEAFRAKNIPLIWVGVPITKDDHFADDMAAFNEIYRDAAAKTGATYVDTWEAFSDANGDFSSYGPDVNGQTVRLRSADGVLFTRAGERKLAHFVEAHVRRALEGKTPPPQLPTADLSKEPGKSGEPVAAIRPDAGPIRNLNEPPSAANGTLASLDRKAPREGWANVSLVHDGAAPVPAGRADDARWSGKSLPEP